MQAEGARAGFEIDDALPGTLELGGQVALACHDAIGLQFGPRDRTAHQPQS